MENSGTSVGSHHKLVRVATHNKLSLPSCIITLAQKGES